MDAGPLFAYGRAPAGSDVPAQGRDKVPRSSCARCSRQLHIHIRLLTQRDREAHLQAVVSLFSTQGSVCHRPTCVGEHPEHGNSFDQLSTSARVRRPRPRASAQATHHRPTVTFFPASELATLTPERTYGPLHREVKGSKGRRATRQLQPGVGGVPRRPQAPRPCLSGPGSA
jgi:hypothetical protein